MTEEGGKSKEIVPRHGIAKWLSIEEAPRTHRLVARLLIVRPDSSIENICTITQLKPGTVREIIKYPPLMEYVDEKRASKMDMFLAAHELFANASSDAILVVEEIMKDVDEPSFARLKAAEILLDRDPHQVFPDRSKMQERSEQATISFSTAAIEASQEKGQLMVERASKRVRVIEAEVTPVPVPATDETPTETPPDA